MVGWIVVALVGGLGGGDSGLEFRARTPPCVLLTIGSPICPWMFDQIGEQIIRLAASKS